MVEEAREDQWSWQGEETKEGGEEVGTKKQHEEGKGLRKIRGIRVRMTWQMSRGGGGM